jgi:hypothetical protein
MIPHCNYHCHQHYSRGSHLMLNSTYCCALGVAVIFLVRTKTCALAVAATFLVRTKTRLIRHAHYNITITRCQTMIPLCHRHYSRGSHSMLNWACSCALAVAAAWPSAQERSVAIYETSTRSRLRYDDRSINISSSSRSSTTPRACHCHRKGQRRSRFSRWSTDSSARTVTTRRETEG